MAGCKIGIVELNDQLSCPDLWLPDYEFQADAYAFGGGNISSSPVLHDLALTAALTNNVWSGFYTIANIHALLFLADGPQPFEHPLATLRGITGITVFVDKKSVAALEPVAPDATPSAPEFDGIYAGDGGPYLYSGTINLMRLT